MPYHNATHPKEISLIHFTVPFISKVSVSGEDTNLVLSNQPEGLPNMHL